MEAIPERQLTVGVGGGLEAGFAESVGNTNFILSGIADASVTLGPVKLGAGAEATRSAAAPCWKGKGRITFGISGRWQYFAERTPQRLSESVGKHCFDQWISVRRQWRQYLDSGSAAAGP